MQSSVDGPKTGLNSDWSRAVVEAAVEGIITIDERGIIEYANPAAHTMFGYDEHELVGKNISTIAPSPHRKRHDEYISRYLRTGERKIIGVGREVLGQKLSGEIFPVHLAISEAFVDGKRMFTGIVHDMTEAKMAEVEKDRLLTEISTRNRELNCLYRVGELLRSEPLDDALLNQVVDEMHAALASQAISGVRILLENRDYASKAFQNTPWVSHVEIVIDGLERGRVEVHRLSNTIAGTADTTGEGHRNIVEAIASMIGETLERREAEAKVAHASKLASIGELAAGVGHEINNPVNSIINCADIVILETKEGTKARQFSELIRSEADRIARIVRDLLTFSRQDEGHYSSVKLLDVVDSVLNLSRKRLEKSRIKLAVDIPDSIPNLECRSEQLQQVVMNLVINAMHALDERYRGDHPNKCLTIRAEHRTREEQILLIVEDHGCGIPDSNVRRIFDPFFTTKGRDHGTGLGLSVSEGIVRSHGGSISVKSQVGKYTAFTVVLPVKSKANTHRTEDIGTHYADRA